MTLTPEALTALGRFIIVTGTDTGVGKTFASAELLARLREQGRRTAYIKPAQTGTGRPGPDGKPHCPVTGEEPDTPDTETITTLQPQAPVWEGTRLSEPLSPRTAARLDGVQLPSLEATAAWIRSRAEGSDHVIIEGAGGILVDLCEDGGPLELATALAQHAPTSLVLVSRAGLGTLNHTALSLRHAQNHGWDPYLCLGNWGNPTPTEELNRQALKEMASPGRWLGEIPRTALA